MSRHNTDPHRRNPTTVDIMTSRDNEASRTDPCKIPQSTRRHRLDAIDASAGTLSESFPSNYLEELRADWPE